MFKKMAFIALGMGIVYGIAATQVRFVLTATPSLPYRFFVLLNQNGRSTHVPAQNDYVLFYHKGLKVDVMKQVKGVPGSTLRYDEQGNLWVADFCVGLPRKQSTTGEPLMPLFDGVIPKGFFFAYAPHEKSFDSRYANFGLIPIASIKGVGVAVL